MKISAPKNHTLFCQDSNLLCFPQEYDLVVTSPPYFHPHNKSLKHGFSPKVTNVLEYSDYVAQILLKAFSGLKPNKFLCIIKTDFWYKGVLTPLGFHIVQSCISLGMYLHAHWIWRKKNFYSPYGPSFSNIFILGHPPFQRIQYNGIINTENQKRGASEVELFATIIELFTEKGAVILDPFVGKGAMLEAAIKTERIGVGVDISPEQFKLAQIRLERLNSTLNRD